MEPFKRLGSILYWEERCLLTLNLNSFRLYPMGKQVRGSLFHSDVVLRKKLSERNFLLFGGLWRKKMMLCFRGSGKQVLAEKVRIGGTNE